MTTKSKRSYRGLMLMGTAAAAALFAGQALAQQANAPADQTAQNQSAATGLEQVVVTAQSQRDLDQQGTQQFKDLVGNVPGVFINQSLGTGLANVEIRGIVQG